jgi:hypothetical protein
VPAVQAAITAAPTDDHQALIRKFQRTGMHTFESAFQALTLQAEGMELRAYNAGENNSRTNATVGIGYHIPSALRDIGRAKVLEEFRKAGISATDSANLLSRDPAVVATVTLTPQQSLSLLAVTMPRYKQMVVDRLGEAKWKRLGAVAGPEGQAGVVWSAYNGAFWQHASETAAAISTGDRLAIAETIGGTAKIGGRSQENHNLALARAAVASRATFDYAIGYGNRQAASSRVVQLRIDRTPVAHPSAAPADSRLADVDPSLAAPDFQGSGQLSAVGFTAPVRAKVSLPAYQGAQQDANPPAVPPPPSPRR